MATAWDPSATELSKRLLAEFERHSELVIYFFVTMRTSSPSCSARPMLKQPPWWRANSPRSSH